MQGPCRPVIHVRVPSHCASQSRMQSYPTHILPGIPICFAGRACWFTRERVR